MACEWDEMVSPNEVGNQKGRKTLKVQKARLAAMVAQQAICCTSSESLHSLLPRALFSSWLSPVMIRNGEFWHGYPADPLADLIGDRL